MLLNQYPDAWVAYLYEYHVTRDYFECHELLEEYWKETGQSDELLVAFIQIAVGAYHARRGNESGARKMWGSARSYLNKAHETYHGIHVAKLCELIEQWMDHSQSGCRFSDTELPFADFTLKDTIEQLAKQKGRTFGDPSDLTNIALIDRHKRRDRSDVIASRLQSLARKRSITVDDKL